jgi:ankyrin repeat protein
VLLRAAVLRRGHVLLSALLEALYRGEGDRVAALLAADPQLDVFEAAAVGRTERLRQLLDDDPELAAAWADDGFTPLHLASFFRHPEAARLLIERGAPIDAVARNEEIAVTPLQSAVTAGEEETAELLLARGADPRATSDDGKTAADVAEERGHPELAQKLRVII